jgi:hypothetical protein
MDKPKSIRWTVKTRRFRQSGTTTFGVGPSELDAVPSNGRAGNTRALSLLDGV